MDFFSYIISNTKRYDFRAFVLISFLLQFVLLIAAPFRKKTSNRELLFVVGLAYLVSDWASNFAVGLIPPINQGPQNDVGSDLLMLWAPFLLLHIGGVDSIAALSFTDNELWSRFAIQLATMIYGIANAFYRSFTESSLKVPVMLMFVAGFSSFLERILCLSQARFSSLKESLLELRQKTDSSKKPLLDLDDDLSDAKLLVHAYRLFESFKALFVDLHVDSDDRRKSQEYFRRRDPAEAFRVVEIELNFSYDLFYTKAPLIRHGAGRFLRPICMICEAMALVLWFRIDKAPFKTHKLDKLLTYALLVGALARDVISLLMVTFSNWILARVASKWTRVGSKLVNVWLSLRKRRWDKYSSSKEAPFSLLLSRALFRQWSESIPRVNMVIDVCLLSNYTSEKRERSSQELGVDFALNKLKRVHKEWFTNDLRDFIFRELKDISSSRDLVESSTAASTSRGQWTLENYNPRVEELACISNTWIKRKTFDESLLLWHIATTLCYHTEEGGQEDQMTSRKKPCCEFSLLLSDYMLYLLLRRPEMMLEVAAMGDMRHEATRAKFMSFFLRFYDELNNEDDDCRLVKLVCQELLNNVSDQDEGYSVLYGACRLAKELKELEERGVIEMWEVISKVWVEMLSYGAARCSPSAHAAELANGGELLTLVWLLMEHLGSGI